MNIDKQNSPLVSVILSVYNRKYILERALSSLVRQTFKDYELIIVDDGSTDKTEEIIFPHLKKHENFKYIRCSNRGVALARNIGILNSRSTYIAFIDSDDEYMTNHLEKMVTFMKSNLGIDFVHSLPEFVGNEEDMWLLSAADMTRLIHVNDCVYGGTFFAKREVFIQTNGFKYVSYGVDYFFYDALVSSGKFKVHKLNEKTYVYYCNLKDSICNSVKKLYCKSS